MNNENEEGRVEGLFVSEFKGKRQTQKINNDFSLKELNSRR
jgi:hypothetical protein